MESYSGCFLTCHDLKESKIAVAKGATNKKRSKKLFIGFYSDDALLCPASALKAYINRTKKFKMKLFLRV